jgi:hypothetical protein
VLTQRFFPLIFIVFQPQHWYGAVLLFLSTRNSSVLYIRSLRIQVTIFILHII